MAPGTFEKQNRFNSVSGARSWGVGDLGEFFPTAVSPFKQRGPTSRKPAAPLWPPHPPAFGEAWPIWLVHVSKNRVYKQTRQPSRFPLEQARLCRAWVSTTLACASSLSESPAIPSGSQWPSPAWMGMGSPRPKLSLRQSPLHQDCLCCKSDNILVS